MTNLLSALKNPRREPPSGNENTAVPVVVLAFDHRTLAASNEAICLDSCGQSERIVVNTRRSVYELIVLQGAVGDVLVRGGAKFPEFRRARFVGSTAGGSALKMNTIDVGLRMEFHLGCRIVITSPVQAFSRHACRSEQTESAVVH